MFYLHSACWLHYVVCTYRYAAIEQNIHMNHTFVSRKEN